VANPKKRVLILFSGGIDSSACIDYYKKKGFKVECLFIDFGQLSSVKELNAVKRVSKFYNIKYSKIKLSGYQSFSKGLVQGRNMFLVSSALLMLNKMKYGIVALGIHSGTNYSDCSPQFVNLINDLFDLYTGGRIILGAPFLQMDKGEIMEYCIINNIPIELSYSCELGLEQPCNKCSSCKDLKKIYASKNHHTKTS
jgi:7-cyano-7-deazaguanine synthase